MKTTLKYLIASLLIVASAGCAAQKSAGRKAANPESAALHAQALKALEDRRFVIEADEFFYTKDRSVKSAAGCSISVKDNWAVIHYSPSLFPNYETFEHMNIEGTPEIIDLIRKKNGDLQFKLKVTSDNKSWMNGRLLITLYRNTNNVYVKAGQTFSLTGRLVPLKD